MKKCLVWGAGNEYNLACNQLLFEELKNNLSVEAIISKDKYAKYIDGKLLIDKRDICNYDYDYIIIFNLSRYLDIKKEAIEVGVPENKIINGKVFNIPYFDFKRYCSLVENPVTIISDDCWGGTVYNYLSLKFNSPFINFFTSSIDYIKLLENLDYYLKQELILEEECDIYSCSPSRGSLGFGDNKIIFNFNHHSSFNEAKIDWDKRKVRIHNNNLFIKLTLKNNNDDLLKRFDNLGYRNKVCFVPKPLSYNSTVYLPRYYWENLHNCRVNEIGNLAQYVRSMNSFTKSIDILSMLCGEDNFIREI